jgi:hypothetical protein
MALQRQLSLTSARRCILRIRAEDLRALEKHLFQRYPYREWGTFFRFGYRRTSWGLALSYVAPALPGPGDLDRLQGITRFTDQYSRRAFQDSATNPLGTGVAHSHPEGFRTWPSSLDDDMDLYFAREFSSYSRGAPYCSIILQRSDRTGLTFTGRVFDKGEWVSVESLISVGPVIDRYESELHLDTRRSSLPTGESTTARLAAVMGNASVDRLKRGVVGIVGTSGTGSPSAHVLARSQVGGFVLVDPQRFAPSNHERFHVSTHADLSQAPAPYKVELARRLIECINPEAHVSTIAGNILHDNVLDELLTCDVLVGGTDTQHGRAALSDIASHYLLPSIDVGVLMDGANGRVSTQLVDVTVYSPNLPCGFCAGRIDGIALSHELLSDTELRERELAAVAAAARGDDPDQYWHRRRQFHTVGYLTTLAGALAAGYVEGWLTGAFEPPHPSFQFDIGQQRLGAVAPPRLFVPGCNCQSQRGRADQAYAYRNVLRPPHWSRRGILLHQGSRSASADGFGTLNRRSN